MKGADLVPAGEVERLIIRLRGECVLLDVDMARLYGVETKILVRSMKRNIDRFPTDFMFQLNEQEFQSLRYQNGTSSQWGGRRYPPYAFTEQGVAMLSSVLRSPRAIQVNIEIMRVFVRFRRMLASNDELARKLDELEQNYDEQFRVVFEAIRGFMTSREDVSRRRIGYTAE